MAEAQTAAGTQPTVGDKVVTGWLPGITATVTQLFGVFEAILGINAPHTGIDLSVPGGSPLAVPAGEHGTVKVAGPYGGYGNAVMVDLGNGYEVLFGHLKDVTVNVGQAVNPGDLLGHADSTGLSTGNHVHFEVRKNGAAINPWPWIKGAVSAGEGVVSAAAGVPAAVGNAAALAGQVKDFIGNSTNWWRILLLAIGATMIFAGLIIYFRPGTVIVSAAEKASAYKGVPVPTEGA